MIVVAYFLFYFYFTEKFTMAATIAVLQLNIEHPFSKESSC